MSRQWNIRKDTTVLLPPLPPPLPPAVVYSPVPVEAGACERASRFAVPAIPAGWQKGWNAIDVTQTAAEWLDTA